MSSFSRNALNAGRAKERKTVKSYMSDKHDDNNLIAAQIIMGDIEKYGGEGSGLVLWADIFLKRMAKQRADDNRIWDSRTTGQQAIRWD
jgi:hypothetical protein